MSCVRVIARVGTRSLSIALVLAATSACRQAGQEEELNESPPAARADAREPRRVAAQDSKLRVMVAELAAARACEMIRGQFRGLRAADRPDTVTGVFWIRGCRITQRGTHVTFHLSGHGWQWVEAAKKKAGGSFALRQYVRFSLATAISGALDVAYDTSSHVVSFWFTVKGTPEIQFSPLEKVDIDTEGAWSWIVGALGSAFASSPDDTAREESEKSGAREFRKSFAEGFSVTVNLCTGLQRFGLERPRQGRMVAPDAGETRDVPVELRPGGLLVAGPHIARRGMSVQVHAHAGAVHTELVCRDRAEALARAYLEGKGRWPHGRALAVATVSRARASTLRSRPAACPVMVVAWPAPGSRRPVRFDYRRPPSETARAAGGPIIQCDADRE
jgi:hypothetical protein